MGRSSAGSEWRPQAGSQVSLAFRRPEKFCRRAPSAIDGVGQGEIINLTDRRARASRRCQLGVLHSLGPDGIARELSALGELGWKAVPKEHFLPHLVMPAHHDVRLSDVLTPRLYANLAAAADRGPADFAELLLVPGVGARTVRVLAMVAEVVHGAPYRVTDPARYSFAHGGKDRHPFPVPLRVYDQTVQVLKSAVQSAKLGREEEQAALKRLDDQARLVERHASGRPVEELIAQERRFSHSYRGRSVFGWEFPPRDCVAVNSAGGHSGSGQISGKRFKFARMTPRGRGHAFVSRFVIVPAVYGHGFCAYEGHPLGRCSLPSRAMLELRQPLTNLEKALPWISFERRKPVQRVPDCEVV